MFVHRERQTKHLEELEEQQRFAEQLQQLADPTAPDPTAAAAAEALAIIVEGLGSSGSGSGARLSTINPALLVTNTWAVAASGDGATDENEEAEAAAAAEAQRYYKQLHESAKRQAQLNAQVKGSYGLRAYKGAFGWVIGGGLPM